MFDKPLISNKYREQQLELHKRHNNYGTASVSYIKTVASIMIKHGYTTLLDYGAGKQNLYIGLEKLKNLPFLEYVPYDPAIPIISALPKPMPFLVCIDVLEHIEEEYIDNVLDHIKYLLLERGLFTLALIPASKYLNDGRNAHILLKPKDWWLEKIESRFKITNIYMVGKEEVLVLNVERL